MMLFKEQRIGLFCGLCVANAYQLSRTTCRTICEALSVPNCHQCCLLRKTDVRPSVFSLLSRPVNFPPRSVSYLASAEALQTRGTFVSHGTHSCV